MSAVVFDLDGTLLHSAPDVLDALSQALQENNLVCGVPMTEQIIGPPVQDMLIQLGFGSDPAVLAHVVASFRRVYDASAMPLTYPYPGAVALLQDLQAQGRRVYLATHKPLAPTLALENRFFPGLIEDIRCTDSIPGRHLSKTGMLQELAAHHSLVSEQTVMVGDGVGDIVAGKALGWMTIAVGWGYGTHAQLKAERPDHLVAEVSELHCILGRR